MILGRLGHRRWAELPGYDHGSPESIAGHVPSSKVIPELIATEWLADVRGTERSLHTGPRWEAGGTSWLEHQSAMPNLPSYYFLHGPGMRPSTTEPSDA